MEDYLKIMESWVPPKEPEIILSEQKYIIIKGPHVGCTGRININHIL